MRLYIVFYGRNFCNPIFTSTFKIEKALNKVIRIYTHQIASLSSHRIASKPFKS